MVERLAGIFPAPNLRWYVTTERTMGLADDHRDHPVSMKVRVGEVPKLRG